MYLVPDLGRGEITALHDRLYTGPMAPHLRRDTHFVAHMTIGHAAEADPALDWGDSRGTSCSPPGVHKLKELSSGWLAAVP